MPPDFWLAIGAQLLVIGAAALRLERRLATLEADVRWLISRRRTDRENRNGTHQRP